MATRTFLSEAMRSAPFPGVEREMCQQDSRGQRRTQAVVLERGAPQAHASGGRAGAAASPPALAGAQVCDPPSADESSS